MNMKAPEAALLIIGNEILSGRTQDLNARYIALKLAPLGIPLREIRVVADTEAGIAEALNALRARYDYVFTTGGIGPTHDDVTSESTAAAFGLKLVPHDEAMRMLEAYYGPGNLNDGRRKMGVLPEGAGLIPNAVSGAPGFQVENVFVMAGIPHIMQAMFDHVAARLRHGRPILTRELETRKPESVFAAVLEDIQKKFGERVDVGSYPYVGDGFVSVKLALRGVDQEALDEAAADIEERIIRAP